MSDNLARKQTSAADYAKVTRATSSNIQKTKAEIRNPLISSDDMLRNQIVIDYSPLIRYIAQKIAARLPANIELDDLIAAGVVGLMDAIEKYDPSRENKFKTYAEFRIRGAMLDELRNQDWVPRSVRESNKKDERARAELEQKLNRPATDGEVAAHLAVSLSDYHSKAGRTRVSMLSIEDLGGVQSGDRKSLLECLENPNSKNPFAVLKNKKAEELITQTVEELPEKQKLVLSLYYYEDLNLKEIGRILEVTESRVSQLHTQAIQKLRQKLKTLLID